jgi:hypothetical protein
LGGEEIVQEPEKAPDDVDLLRGSEKVLNWSSRAGKEWKLGKEVVDVELEDWSSGKLERNGSEIKEWRCTGAGTPWASRNASSRSCGKSGNFFFSD